MDARELRSRLGSDEDDLASFAEMLASPGIALVGMTRVKAAYPTTANSFVYVEICKIAGNELENTVPTLTGTGQFLFAVCRGAIPTVNTPVLAKSVEGGYWVL